VENDEVSVPLHPYGISAQTESSWEEFLSSAHRQFVAEYIDAAQIREAAVIDQFLASIIGH
jgi:hypothetical protein